MIQIVMSTIVLLSSSAALATLKGYNPEPGSNIKEMFERMDLWTKARDKMDYFTIGDGSLRPGACDGSKLCNGNSFEELSRRQAFQKLKDAGVGLYIASGSVKPGSNCDADISGRDHAEIPERIRNEGGKVTGLTMDWPRASGKFNCNQTVDETAHYVARYVDRVKQGFRQAHPGEELDVGLYEGYPLLEPTELIDWLKAMERHGYVPSHFLLDIDRNAHKGKGRGDTQMKQFLRLIKTHCAQKGIRFGVVIWTNDLRHPRNYRNDMVSWAQKVKKLVGTPDQVEYASWEYWVQKGNNGNVWPENFPETHPYSFPSLFLFGMEKIFGI